MKPSDIPGIADLPVLDSLEALQAAFAAGSDAVLQAPPGAGKSTVIPLALMDEPWAAGRRVLMLEPRRIAARSVASRMAELLGEPVGQTVGYRMRHETRVCARTRVEVVTEGVLSRMLQSDPALSEVALVIFDEFHERSLDADLALTLTLAGRTLFRDQDPLRLLVMSATLDVDAVAALLGGAPVIRSEGRQFPVEIRHGPAAKPGERIDERIVPAVLDALRSHPRSSQLVFLPGQGEIRRVAGALAGCSGDAEVRPLYGALDLAAQRRAIEPAVDGGRKIVLATNIAETSLTIEGVDVVIDSGLARQAAFDPRTATTRLELHRIARDAADQRAGRAGRTRPGVCYRLWSTQQHGELAGTTPPEILGADLAGLALQLLAFGVADPDELRWLDPPPRGAWQQAVDLLKTLGAIRGDRNGGLRLTARGEAMSRVGAHPRVGRMLLEGAWHGALATASRIAALLEERDPLGREDADLERRLAILSGEAACPAHARGWLERVRRSASRYAERVERLAGTAAGDASPSAADAGARRGGSGVGDGDHGGRHPRATPDAATLVACGWPDRVARRRRSGAYQLANGRSAVLQGVQALGQAAWLAVLEAGGGARRQGEVIGLAAALDPAAFESALAHLVEEADVTEWERGGDRFLAERQRRIGALVLERRRIDPLPPGLRERALLDAVSQRGLGLLEWNAAVRRLRERLLFLHRTLPGEGWPDLSDAALLATLEEWLAPYLGDARRLADLRRIDLAACLGSRLDWSRRDALERLAPARLEVPSGSMIAVDYGADPPVLAVKLQEMFGCTETPRVAGGRVALMLHLLSPAGRPLQVTQDLATFWRDVYPQVRREMRGRYAKHPWPENPLEAAPTRHTRRAQALREQGGERRT